jgi:tRNA uridine 5-carboxymethylaminomethyl modification enzyme
VSRASLGQDLGAELADAVIDQLEIAVKYAGYIDKQRDEVERSSHFEHLRLPPDLDYAQVTALSIEVRQKLTRARPETLGQASRISGVTPAAISLLLVHLKKKRLSGFGLRGLTSAMDADADTGAAMTSASPDLTTQVADSSTTQLSDAA